jgi:hypothetical protein
MMKSILLSCATIISCVTTLHTQIECIRCYQRNDPISPDAINLVLNGGFENHDCTPSWFNGSYCPSSNLYDCDIEDWRCLGGGTNSYPIIFDTTLSVIPEGQYAAYFGNGNAFMCMEFSFDTSCLIRDGCTVSGFPPGMPTTLEGYGGPGGVTLEQTVDNFVVGETYVLEFWAGGEPLQGLLLAPGVFAIDIGFGLTYLTCLPTEHPDGVGTTYLVRFRAASPTHTITFTNWGHMCIDCTELVIDNVRLYTLAELDPSVQECITAVTESSDADEVVLFPNPVTDILHINLPSGEPLWIEIYDGQGRSVAADFTDREVDMGSLEPGVYFLVVKGEGGVIVKSIVRI